MAMIACAGALAGAGAAATAAAGAPRAFADASATGSAGIAPFKDRAATDFRAALPDALGPCISVDTGVGVLAAGAVWFAGSFRVPGGIPFAGVVTATGEVMLNASPQMCGSKLRRLLDDYRIWKDPPDPRYTRLVGVRRTRATAHVHACGDLHNQVKAFCLKLRSLAERLIPAADHTGSVDDALTTTINRASGAALAGNRAALNAQLHHGKQLHGELTQALGSEAAIGRGIKRLLGSGHLTVAQAGKATTHLEALLGRKGLAAGEVSLIDPAVARIPAVDPVARLAHP